MEPWVQAIVVSLTTVGASSGFWAWLQTRSRTRNATDKLLMVIARERIMTQGMRYIQRGWISNDELDDFDMLLYQPYKALGGNGVAERIYEDVSHLPLRSYARYSELTEGELR